MDRILNLTQHESTADQKADGVYEPEGKKEVQRLLTFENLPNKNFIAFRASQLAELAVNEGAESVMIGGAPYLMAPLEFCLQMHGIRALYAFSNRESVEKTLPDGSVKKTQVFKHTGWIEK